MSDKIALACVLKFKSYGILIKFNFEKDLCSYLHYGT